MGNSSVSELASFDIFVGLRQASITRALCSTSVRAHSRPMPDVAPVMRIVLDERSGMEDIDHGIVKRLCLR